jgi:hypothetical protein
VSAAEMAHFAFTVTAVVFIGMALRTTAQTTDKPWEFVYDPTDPWFPISDPALDPIVCHTEPWDRTNPNTPTDGPGQHICPCNYPYHHKQRMCCKPQGYNDGPDPKSWGIRAPYFYAAAGLSVEAHKSVVDGTMLCPCGYALNTTTNICHTLKDDKYEDRCPCGTTKNPANGGCYYINATDPSGPYYINGTNSIGPYGPFGGPYTFPTEQWGACLDAASTQTFFYRWLPEEWRYTPEHSGNICPCEYVWNKNENACCKLAGARSPFYYGAVLENSATPVLWGANDTKQYCACGYFQDDRDGRCRSMKPLKYEDVCPCGWYKDPSKQACMGNGFQYPGGYYQVYKR